MKNTGKKKILVAPLDWGLGHATRCITIIRQLILQEHQVLIAADGHIKNLLQQEFPEITFLPLKGYRITYGKTKLGLFFRIVLQLPKLMRSITYENRWLKKKIAENKIDMVISDNRYGLFNKKIYTIFITHQLSIQSPLFKGLLQKLNYHFINKFDTCWIPDFKGEPNLAGKLSHPIKMPSVPVKYIGPLSRIKVREEKSEKDVLIILSGPEPQRSVLEALIIEQLNMYTKPVLLVRGLPRDESILAVNENVTCINHLPATEMEEAIGQASFIIGRSGYSSIMDLIPLKKKTILIPTPGQTEQEYLATHLYKQNMIFYMAQENFNLSQALKSASVFPYKFYNWDELPTLKKNLAHEDFFETT